MLPKIDMPIYEVKLISNGKKLKFRPFTVKEEKLFLMANQGEELDNVVDTIKQVINNLIHNAVKYSETGTIEIVIGQEKLEHRVDAVSFSIIDTGIGLPENELHNIFGPFIQSSYTKKISEGKGLGLAICERIILLHHGKIWAKNNVDQPGSTFYFLIPIDRDDI